MTNDEYDETVNAFSIGDDDNRQLTLILKSFVRIRENVNFVVKADFEKMKFDLTVIITTLMIFLLKNKSII